MQHPSERRQARMRDYNRLCAHSIKRFARLSERRQARMRDYNAE